MYYVYLISSLPMLKYNDEPPFSYEGFIKASAGLIPDKDIAVLNGGGQLAGRYNTAQQTLKKWQEFDTALRDELVKLRAGRLKADPAKYLRNKEEYTEPSIIHTASAAYRSRSILEAEQILDDARWRKLDELETGHYFDFDFLICYALKLLILLRRGVVKKADRERLLGETLEMKN